MFESITLQRSTGRQPLTAGELAEALLFYQNVHVVFNETNLAKLAQAVGMPILLEILSRPNVSAVYCDNGVTGTMTNTVGGVQIHDLCSIHSAVNQNTRKSISDRTQIFEFILERRAGCSGFEAKRYARALREVVPFRSYANDDFIEGGVFKVARQDLLDHAYVYESVRRSLKAFVPSCPPLPMFRFDVIQVDGGFVVDTDLDFVRLNQLLPTDGSGDLQISPAALLDVIFTARFDLSIAAHYGSELHTSSIVSDIMRLRYVNVLENENNHLPEIGIFQEIVFSNGRTIKEAIDSGERRFSEFLPLLDKSKEFKEWIKNVDPSEKIVAEYFRSVTAQDWISSLPAKVIRYMIVLAAGLIEQAVVGSAVSGPILSAADQFVVEKSLGGWRPNHFVDAELRPFVGE